MEVEVLTQLRNLVLYTNTRSIALKNVHIVKVEGAVHLLTPSLRLRLERYNNNISAYLYDNGMGDVLVGVVPMDESTGYHKLPYFIQRLLGFRIPEEEEPIPA